MHRDQQGPACLLLPHRDAIAFDMLPAHARHVADALRRVEQERHRYPRLCADRMVRLEPRDLVSLQAWKPSPRLL